MHPPPFPQPAWGQPHADPGPIPLRPLSVGDVLAVSFGVVRRHLAVLGVVAALIAAVTSTARIGLLAATGTLEGVISGQLLDDVLNGRSTSLPWEFYAAAGVSAFLSIAGVVVLSGMAASLAGEDAIGGHGSLTERMRGRWRSLFAAAIAMGILIPIGLAAFVVPGVLLYLAWAVAGPAAAMEGSTSAGWAERSKRLTRGDRGRVLGLTLLILLISFGIEQVISAVALSMAGPVTDLAAVIIGGAVGAVVSAVTLSWVAAVIAVIYIDLRVRKENLAPALRAFAARAAS